FFSSRRRHTMFSRDWSSDVCSSDLRGADVPASPEPSPGSPVRNRLPKGFVVELGRRVRVFDRGRTLAGGVPPRVAHLGERARSMLRGRRLEVADAASERLADRLLAMGMADPVVAELPPVDLAELTVVVPVHD